MSSDDFLPTASLEQLKNRSDILHHLRDYFYQRHYMEVETPLLSHETIVDAHLNSFVVSADDSSRENLYLQTSPEAGMKRLLAAGARSIFQITRSFRKGEVGKLHNPEFTIVEWYQAGDKPADQMKFIEEMLQTLVRKCSHKTNPCLLQPFQSMTYDEVFKKYFGMTVLNQETESIINQAIKKNIVFPMSFQSVSQTDWDRDDLLNFLLSEMIEPELGREAPMFIHGYPPSQAALAKVAEKPVPVAERFELYYKGIELCNGYHELTDADELEKRTKAENRKRVEHGYPPLPAPEKLIQAMRSGLPDCTGVALGFDRLLMLLSGKSFLEEVIAFPFPRA